MFKLGDRVRCIVEHPDRNPFIRIGHLGTVCDNEFGCLVRVRWDNYVEGHTCGGYCEEGYGWTVNDKEVEYAETDPEVEIDEKKFTNLVTSKG